MTIILVRLKPDKNLYELMVFKKKDFERMLS